MSHLPAESAPRTPSQLYGERCHLQLTIVVSFPMSPLTDCLPLGDSLVAHGFIRSLAERGHTVHVLTPSVCLEGSLPPNTHVHHMAGGRWRHARASRVAYCLWARQKLKSIKKVREVHVVHELNPVFVGTSLAFAHLGVPVVLGPHVPRWASNAGLLKPGILARSASNRLKSLVGKLCLSSQHRLAQAVLLSTPAALSAISRPDRIQHRLFVLPHGIDDERFAPGNTPASQHPTVLFLANLWIGKGVYTLLEAFEAVSRRIPGVRLTIAGSGEEEAEVRRQVAASSFANHVSFTGRIKRVDVPDLIRQCTVFCVPSYGEPFGMSALEAMACGKPLVITDAGGLPYVVPEAGSLRVPVRNAAALADALSELLLRPDLCRQMGQYNRREVECRYAWPQVAAQLEAIYYEVLGLKGYTPLPTHLTASDLTAFCAVPKHRIYPAGETLVASKPKANDTCHV
jgi:L-malate glycosyltransferase